MRPRGPNENTKAIEVVKGGEISGRKVKKSISRDERRRARDPLHGEGEDQPEQRAGDADQRRQQQAVAAARAGSSAP